MKHLETPAGRVPLPAFFPDATYGAIRAGSFEDIYRGGLYGCEMNSYHLMTKPGAKLVKSLGDQSVNDSVSTSRAVVERDRGQGFRFIKYYHQFRPPAIFSISASTSAGVGITPPVLP